DHALDTMRVDEYALRPERGEVLLGVGVLPEAGGACAPGVEHAAPQPCRPERIGPLGRLDAHAVDSVRRGVGWLWCPAAQCAPEGTVRVPGGLRGARGAPSARPGYPQPVRRSRTEPSTWCRATSAGCWAPGPCDVPAHPGKGSVLKRRTG
ncbi:hypothetical protein EF908_31115, partial [Streptomyces sp. WAC04770]